MNIRLASLYLLCGLVLVLSGCERGNAAAASSASPPVEVEVAPAVRKSLSLQQRVPGRLQAVRTAEIRARVEGVVEKLLFVEGTEVKAGAPLYRLDDRLLHTQVRSAQAALGRAIAERHLASQTLARLKPLVATEAISRLEFEQAEAQHSKAVAETAAAEATLNRALLDLEHAHITAPIAGRVGRTRVTEGALVGQKEATHLTTIEQVDPIRVNFTQSSPELFRLRRAIRQGDARPAEPVEVRLLLDDESLYPLPGVLHFTDMAVDPQTGSVALRAEFPNPERVLLPGQFVRVQLSLATVEGVTVPQRAVQSSPQGQRVLMVDAQNKVVARTIQTGGFSGQEWIVTEGVQEGEKVIVNGVQKARPGAVVTPKEAEIGGSPGQTGSPPPARTP